jgi:Glyoxalase-like domain
MRGSCDPASGGLGLGWLISFWRGNLSYMDEPTDQRHSRAVLRHAEVRTSLPRHQDKTVKNRLHLDVSPTDREQDEEVRRLLDLGARHADVGQGDESWVVLADPEGTSSASLRTAAPDRRPHAAACRVVPTVLVADPYKRERFCGAAIRIRGRGRHAS